MNVGVIGLGRMGAGIAHRLHAAGHTVVGFDPNADTRAAVEQEIGIATVSSLSELAQKVRIFWLLVPAGDIVDNVINDLKNHICENDVIIDAGNSNFHDSIRRAKDLQKGSIYLLDCGTSGGVAGKEVGYSLMVGGDEVTFDAVEPLFQAVAAPSGYGYIGRSGTGHYVKMVHNGIEYALLQAYGEGLDLIKNGHFKDDKIDLEQLTGVWQNGSVIRSWIVELANNVFKQDQELADVVGSIAESGTGKWTVQEAHKYNIPVKLIEESLLIRAWSRETGGNYGTKVVAMLRNQFGGHAVTKKNGEDV